MSCQASRKLRAGFALENFLTRQIPKPKIAKAARTALSRLNGPAAFAPSYRLQETVRIDVYMQVEAAARRIDARKPFRQVVLQIGLARSLHQKALPVAGADDRKRGFDRP